MKEYHILKQHFLLTILTLALTTASYAQLSKQHYIPPFYAHNEGSITAQEQVVYLSTPHANANYTITDGSGNVLQTGAVQNGISAKYYMLSYGTAFACDATELNKPLTNKGLIITSDSAVYANLRVNAGSFSSPAQGGSLTSKGIDALGTTYRLGHLPSPTAHGRKCAGYSIMATQNNTTVTIDFKSPNVVFHGAGAPLATTPLTINLNAGECYVAAIHSQDDAGNLDTGLVGTLITSDKAIAVNTGSWGGNLKTSSSADVGIDQIVDESLVGIKYVMVQGESTDIEHEQVMIVAHHDKTIIKVNNSASNLDTINAGEYRLIDGSNYVNEVMYVETSEPSYVYQMIMGGVGTENTQGMNFVPPITCYTADEINSIPSIDSIGTKIYAGGITIVTKKGSTILVNGAAPSVAPVDALGSIYEAYKIENLKGDVVVSTNSIALVGFFGFSGDAGYGGYYSGFDRVTFSSNVIEECPPGVLYSSSNLNGTYQWHINDLPISGATDDTLSFTNPGNYYVEFTKDECKDTSATIEIIPNPTVDMGLDFTLCENKDTTVVLSPDNGATMAWFGTDTSNQIFIDTAGTYWVELTNVKGCKSTDSLKVDVTDCSLQLIMPQVFKPNGSGMNDAFAPVVAVNVFNTKLIIYNRWGMKVAEVVNLKTGWDGRINGEIASDGVYFWTLSFESSNFNVIEKHFRNGFVQLL